MRTIGMLGGMSWESSAEYYRLANELVRERLGGLHSARCVLYSVDFADIEHLQVSGRWAEAGEVLAGAARGLEAAGADLIVLCTNTMHLVADAVSTAVGIPLLHIVDVTAAAVRAAGVERVGLLGTRFTMEGTFHVERLAANGVAAVVPQPEQRELVHRVIYDELCQGIVSERSRAALVEVIDSLAGQGAAGVVLGCTELELLLRQEDSRLPVFGSTRLHVTAAVDAALAGMG